MLVRHSIMMYATHAMRWLGSHLRQLSPVVAAVRASIDLLDVILLSALALITIGAALLWGAGTACLVLGSLLLGMIVFGVPSAGKS